MHSKRERLAHAGEHVETLDRERGPVEDQYVRLELLHRHVQVCVRGLDHPHW